MRARRLFALALAAQAFPELLLEPQSERTALARSALRVEGLARGDGEAARLLQLLGDERAAATPRARRPARSTAGGRA